MALITTGADKTTRLSQLINVEAATCNRRGRLQEKPHYIPLRRGAATICIGVGNVVVTIAYISLILGELVPKRIALNNGESIASFVAAPMKVMSRFSHRWSRY